MKPPHTHTNCSKYSLFFFLIIGCTFIILTKHVFSFFSSFHCTIKLAHDMVSKPQLLLLFNILFGWSVWIFGWGEIMVSDVVMEKQYDHWLSNDTIDNQATNITYNANTNNCDIHTLIGHFFLLNFSFFSAGYYLFVSIDVDNNEYQWLGHRIMIYSMNFFFVFAIHM